MSLDSETSPLFREQATRWLALIPPLRSGSPRVFQFQKRRIVLADSVCCPDGFHMRETLLVRGDFHCGVGCRFEQPIYVAGNASVGKSSALDAICTEGSLVAGLDSRIHRWADSRGRIDLRTGAWAGELVSDQAIQLSPDSGAASLMAPEVVTGGGWDAMGEIPPAQSESLEIDPPSSGVFPQLLCVRGFREDRLTALGSETWVYDGSLNFPMPLLLRAKLVVRGSFSCPAGSLLDEDVKAGGSMRLGEGSISRGVLQARGEMTLEKDCLFEGTLKSGLTLRLCSGVRGFREAGPVEASASEKVVLEPNVVVRGHVASGARVVASLPMVEGGLELLLLEN